MPSSLEDVVLIRLHDSVWSCKLDFVHDELQEVRLQMPEWVMAEKAYKLATLAALHLKDTGSKVVKQADEQESFAIDDESIQGQWKIIRHRGEYSLWHSILQWFPFTRTISNKKIALLLILPADADTEHSVKLLNSKKAISRYGVFYNQDLPLAERLLCKDFSDLFTELATRAFQTVETAFTSEHKVKGSYRFVLDKNSFLKLAPRSFLLSEEDKKENRKVVRTFLDFVVQEYGIEHIAYLEQAYGFFFQDMIAKGEELLPDHIFKTNVGVNMILLSHVEALYEKLCHLLNVDDFEVRYLGVASDAFSVRELRGLMREAGIQVFSSAMLREYLKELLGPSPPSCVKSLPQDIFNTIVRMLVPSNEARERAFTGRKIRHRAMCGWTEDVDLIRESLASDFFELLHLFDELENGSYQNFYELLAHVVAKRNLFTSRLEDGKIVITLGLLIPGPSDAQDKEKTPGLDKRWYYSEALVSDREGNFNYVLLPACDAYVTDGRPLPMIKLYRSTVSECNNIDWIGSIKADFNPYGSPGPLHPDKAFHYEKSDLENRTIPLWVGYLLLYKKLKENESENEARHALKQAIIEFMQVNSSVSFLESCEGEVAIYDFLYGQATTLKELPHYKAASDIAFVGHSLGATLSEYYLAKRRDRLPCPGYSFICYSTNPPAIDDELDVAFMEFGRKHKELFQQIQVRWKIMRQFEYGDIFIQGGGTHLGTTGYQAEDGVWLEQESYIFVPHEDAESLTITSLPTHGRRIGGAVRNKDYTVVPITPEQLYAFDHAWWLSPELRALFGFKVLQSPELTERFRKLVGKLMQPLFTLLERREESLARKIGGRDEQGILFARYASIRKKILQAPQHFPLEK